MWHSECPMCRTNNDDYMFFLDPLKREIFAKQISIEMF